MRPLRYSINITVDGCADHTVGMPSKQTHRHAEEAIARADALILGRTTYELMEFWRPLAQPGADIPAGMPAWMLPFAHTIDKAKKYLVSSTRKSVDWNTELVTGDLEKFVRDLKAQPGEGLATGGLTLPLALAEMGLIDEYEFIVQPRLAGHGPYVFAGLSKVVDLRLVEQIPLGSAAVAMRYVPAKAG